MNSRQSFRIQKHNKDFQFVRVSNLGKRRKSDMDIADAFGYAESECLEFLEKSRTSAAPSSSAPSSSSTTSVQDLQAEEDDL